MKLFFMLDRYLITEMHRWAIPILRIALGIVFLWFGALKIFDVSPVINFIHSTYSFFPDPPFIFILGIGEALIGLGLIFKSYLRIVLALLWLQLAGTFLALILEPSIFFQQNIFLLTIEGEFVIKNLVLAAAGLVIGGFNVYVSKRN